MKNLLRQLLIVICATGLIVVLGSCAFQDLITPAYIEPEAIEYTEEEPTSFLPYTTVWDALRIEMELEYQHGTNQLDYARLAEDDIRLYNKLKSAATVHLAEAREFQNAVFSPSSPLGMLLPALFGTGIGAYLIKRPQERELEKKVAKNGQ